MTWPVEVPALTGDEAKRAAVRLWRFAMGETWSGPVKLVSGRKHTWERRGTLYVNPNSWKYFVSDLAWLFFTRANPDARRNTKDIAKLEAKLIKEVVARGWVNPKPVIPEMPQDVKIILATIKREQLIEKRLRDGEKRWTVKLVRAQKALKKIQRKLKRYNR